VQISPHASRRITQKRSRLAAGAPPSRRVTRRRRAAMCVVRARRPPCREGLPSTGEDGGPARARMRAQHQTPSIDLPFTLRPRRSRARCRDVRRGPARRLADPPREFLPSVEAAAAGTPSMQRRAAASAARAQKRKRRSDPSPEPARQAPHGAAGPLGSGWPPPGVARPSPRASQPGRPADQPPRGASGSRVQASNRATTREQAADHVRMLAHSAPGPAEPTSGVKARVRGIS
jgi:hypothetical protein